jgi:hypothetical protein
MTCSEDVSQQTAIYYAHMTCIPFSITLREIKSKFISVNRAVKEHVGGVNAQFLFNFRHLDGR